MRYLTSLTENCEIVRCWGTIFLWRFLFFRRVLNHNISLCFYFGKSKHTRPYTLFIRDDIQVILFHFVSSLRLKISMKIIVFIHSVNVWLWYPLSRFLVSFSKHCDLIPGNGVKGVKTNSNGSILMSSLIVCLLFTTY